MRALAKDTAPAATAAQPAVSTAPVSAPVAAPAAAGAAAGLSQPSTQAQLVTNQLLKPWMLTNPSLQDTWKQALNTDGGDLMVRMKWERSHFLSLRQKNYADLKAMGAADDNELKVAQDQLLAQVLRTINRQIVKAFQDTMIRAGDNSQEQDALHAILLTKEMRDVALGKIYSIVWVEKPWLMPAIRCYVGLLHHFENLNEQTNVNLVTKMAEVLAAAETDSVQAIAQRFEAVVDPLVKTFTTVAVESVFDYFKASLPISQTHMRPPTKC